MTLGSHHRFVVASRMPRKMKSAPTVPLTHRPIIAFVRIRLLKAAANHASTRHQTVPVITNVRPKLRNASTFVVEAGSINWGRNTRKTTPLSDLACLSEHPVEMPQRSCTAENAAAGQMALSGR